MNWIGDMNKALKYIESNLEEDIKSDDIAKEACSSKFHFLRVFNMLTGMTLGEYIRQRRLSLSVKDVIAHEMKIIDIAYKYGYETPEAFTKAFKKLHGLSPTKARKEGKTLKAIPPISFQITVKGADIMNYKLVKKESFKVVGISKRVTSKNGENFKVIPKFWQDIMEDGRFDELHKNKKEFGVMGLCLNFDREQEEFDYMIAVEGDCLESLEGVNVVEIPECTWAVFESVGALPKSIQETWHRIFAEWFPATNYEHADAPEFEAYLDGDTSSKDYKCEAWVPVVEK